MGVCGLVVNCFQILLSSGRRTTNRSYHRGLYWLWIAFKFYYLRDEEQLKTFLFLRSLCCELLSNFIIFGTKNNINDRRHYRLRVVNCFQILLSSGRRTTCFIDDCGARALWIAFKFYYLRDEEQPMVVIYGSLPSCELLSNFIIFGTKNNGSVYNATAALVVNCFQILLSSGRRTTFQMQHPLWR